MTVETSDENTLPTTQAARARSPWLDPRRVRFWLVVAFLAYTLSGFFLAPLLVEKLAVDYARDGMGRDLTLQRVRINPFVLSAEIEGLDLRDPDGETLFALDGLRVDFQASSLFRWAWTFREIRVDGPYVLYERFEPGDDRLSRLFADMDRLAPQPEPEPEPEAGLPRLLIDDLQIVAGRATVRDHAPRTPVVLEAGPVSVEVRQLNTLPDREGRQRVEVRLDDGAAVVWQGSLALAPLRSKGDLAIERLPLDPALHYLDGVVELASLAGRFSLRTDYRLEERDDGSITVELASLETDVDDFAVSAFDPAEDLLAFSSLQTRGGSLTWPEARLDAGRITLAGLSANLQLEADGTPRVLGLLPETAEGDEAAAAADDAAPWRITAERLDVAQARLALEDRSVQPAAALTVAALDLGLEQLDNQDGAVMPLSVAAKLEGGGAIGLAGDLVVLPAVTFGGRGTLEALPVALAAPYVASVLAVRIENGAVDSGFDLELTDAGDIRAAGDATVDDLALSDTIENQPLLAWKRLAIDRFEADTAASKAEISRVALTEPFGRIQVRADRSTNLEGLMLEEAPAPADAPPAEAGPAEPWSFTIAKIDFDDGGMDFSDLSLPLPFAVRISNLEGAIGTVASASSEPAGIHLGGKVGEYGMARIDGELHVFDPLAKTDITMEFRNLAMSDLSPYSIEFAGRRIDEGKLDLKLEYAIEDSRLAGANDIVVSDLVLGEKVDSPNAVSLPLDLAVALLKDSNGVIDIDLPVEGDVNDPEFRIGGVIWKAFTSLITKIVTAPFALLGNLVGGGEDFGQFEFLAGRADLTPPELEKVVKLGEALQQRPQLAIALAGVHDAAVDAPVLRYFRLRDTVFERLERAPADGDDDAGEMLAEEVRGVLEDLFRERFPGEDLDTLRAAHTAPPPGDPEGKPRLDELAYAANLRDRLLESEVIGPDDLRALAEARAEAVRAAFLAAGAIGEERLQLVEPVAVESGDGEWVAMELEVAVP